MAQASFKKNCASCHRIGDEGARIGPTLDGIGVRGVDRLLEDMLDPNRNVDQAFRTTQIVTTAGTIVSGLVLREEGEIVVLADAQGKEVRVPSAEIDQRIGELAVADARQHGPDDSGAGVRATGELSVLATAAGRAGTAENRTAGRRGFKVRGPRFVRRNTEKKFADVILPLSSSSLRPSASL